MHQANDPLVRRQPGSNGPLVAATVSSVIATIVVGATALVAVATSCGFAGGRCDDTSGGSSPLRVALVSVAVTWGATVCVARARNGQQPRWLLYLAAVGIPAGVTAVAVGIMMVAAGA